VHRTCCGDVPVHQPQISEDRLAPQGLRVRRNKINARAGPVLLAARQQQLGRRNHRVELVMLDHWTPLRMMPEPDSWGNEEAERRLRPV
jgi:hypothetical protein